MNLIRLKEKLVNTPHLVSSELFDAVMDVVNSHSVGKYNLSMEDDNEDDAYTLQTWLCFKVITPKIKGYV